MEQYDDKLIPYLLKLENDLGTNAEKWTIQYIRQTREKFHSIVLRLDNVYNSKLGINKLIPDILYNVFTLAVYSSSYPDRTALNISHVCRHWRKSALGWPALWGFLDLNKRYSFFDLLVKRSQSSPLRLKWTKRPRGPYRTLETLDFVHRPNSILPRLYSLTIYATYFDFAPLHHAIQESGSLPTQLRDLNIHLFDGHRLLDHENRPVSPPLTHIMDNSCPCLRSIRLSGLDLPWFELPYSNLTQFTFLKPRNVPSLSQLLVFLFNCPSLKALELDFRDYVDEDTVKANFATGPWTINELVLNLTSLKLRAWGSLSYELLHQFSGYIRNSPGTLSQFEVLYHPNFYDSSGLDQQHIPPPVHILKVNIIPPGIISNFSSLQCLEILSFGKAQKSLQIFGYTTVSNVDDAESTRPLTVIGEEFDAIDSSLILELVHAMPQICHLKLGGSAWAVLTAWLKPKIHDAFPCLHTLELTSCSTEALNSLTVSLPFKRLILEFCSLSGDVLFDVGSRMGIEVLELIGCRNIEDEGGNTDELDMDVPFALRKMGVEVVVRERRV